MVSEIAMQLVKPSVAAFVNEVTANFSRIGPFPQNPDAVQLACWPDDIKSNMRAMNGWHFIDQPYLRAGGVAPPTIEPENIVVEINNMYQSVKRNPNFWELSFAIAWLIHLFGDIHQPLHCVTMYSSQFPTGDAGGNLFKIYVDGVKTDLHGYWDSVCGMWSEDPARPMNASSASTFRQRATLLLQKYNSTFSDSMKRVYDPATMANESYQFAVSDAYGGLQPLDTITTQYHDRCVATAESRIVLAGIRLANQFDYLFSSKRR